MKNDWSGERALHKVMTRMSSATMTVAVEGPKRSTDANTNASDTEIRAATVGIRTVNEPVRVVRAASSSHPLGTGLVYRSTRHARVTDEPAAMTALK